jgi:hypothetical protein
MSLHFPGYYSHRLERDGVDRTRISYRCSLAYVVIGGDFGCFFFLFFFF